MNVFPKLCEKQAALLIGLYVGGATFSPVCANAQQFHDRQTTSAVTKTPLAPDESVAEARRFHDTLKNLSEKYGIVFVIESVPFKLHESVASVTTRTSAGVKEAPDKPFELPETMGARQLKMLLDQQKRRKQERLNTQSSTVEPSEKTKPNLTKEEQVAAFANDYDYRVEERGNIFLLRKRYTNPFDLPDVPLGEGSASLKEITRLLSAYNPDIRDKSAQENFGGMTRAEASFMSSLTTEQEAQMRNGGLQVAGLSQTQKDTIRQIALFYYIQMPFEHAYSTMAHFDQLLKKSTVLRQKKEDGRMVLGYEDPTGWFGGPDFVSLEALPIFATPFPAPTPNETRWESVWLAQRKAAGATTLGQMVSLLNQKRAPTDPVVSVDAPLVEKTITLVGAQKLTPDVLLKAVADVYGLRFKTSPDGTLHLTRRSPQQPKTLAALPAAIRSALPDPLLRALHKEDIDENLDEMGDIQRQEVGTTANSRERIDELLIRNRVWLEHPKQLRMAAIRRLSVRTRRLFAVNPNSKIPIAALDADTKSTIVTIAMTQTLDELKPVLNDYPPRYISQWDKLGVTGGKFKDENGKSIYRLYLALPAPDGKFQMVVGGQTAPFMEK